MAPVRLEPAALPSQVKHFTIEPLHSHGPAHKNLVFITYESSEVSEDSAQKCSLVRAFAACKHKEKTDESLDLTFFSQHFGNMTGLQELGIFALFYTKLGKPYTK